MSILKIEIDLGDSALAHDEWGSELKMVLDSVVRQKVLGINKVNLFDTNGNKIGKYSIE